MYFNFPESIRKHKNIAAKFSAFKSRLSTETGISAIPNNRKWTEIVYIGLIWNDCITRADEKAILAALTYKTRTALAFRQCDS